MLEEMILIANFKNMREEQKMEFIGLLLRKSANNHKVITSDIDKKKSMHKYAIEFSHKNLDETMSDILSKEKLEFLIKRELKLQKIEQMFKNVVDLEELARLVNEETTNE